MESITELRKICQNTRPSIFSDFLSKFYYRIAIYFTWVCLLLGLSANQVTVLSGIIAFIGGLLLGSSHYLCMLTGVLFFHLFAILDMSDGEVARYRKQGGVNGHYLDWYMHFISSTSFMIGLFLASYTQLTNPFLLLIALLAVVFPILDKSIQTSGWTVICWSRLRDLKKNDTDAASKFVFKENRVEKKRGLLFRRLKFLFLAPLQDHWAPLGMLIIIMTDGILRFLNIVVPLDYRFIWLMYVGIFAIPYLYLRVRHLVNGTALLEGYKRIISPIRTIEFPKDDFLD